MDDCEFVFQADFLWNFPRPIGQTGLIIIGIYPNLCLAGQLDRLHMQTKTSGGPHMKGTRIFSAILLLALLSLACSVTDTATKSADATTASTPANRPLYQDDFSDSSSGWDVDSSDNGSVGYENGSYFIKIDTDAMLMWANPNGSSYSNVHVEVDAKSVGEAADTAFGIVCDYQDSDNFYTLGFNSDGNYAIKKYVDGVKTFLTGKTETWISSKVIPDKAASYQVGADCGNGRLTLYANGKQVATVDDSDLIDGDVGLFAYTFDLPNGEILFDNFIVTALK
jgi:hypothetical protein